MKLKRLYLNLLIIVYVMVILTLSVAAINSSKQVSLSSTKVLSIRSDYLLHALLFMPWMLMIRWRWPEKNGYWFFFIALAAGLLLAGISEGIQLFIPGRSANSLDLLANFIGIFIGAFILGWGRLKTVVSRQ